MRSDKKTGRRSDGGKCRTFCATHLRRLMLIRAGPFFGALLLAGCHIDMSGTNWILSDQTAAAISGGCADLWTVTNLNPDSAAEPLIVCLPATKSEHIRGILIVRVPGHSLAGWPIIELSENRRAWLLGWEVSPVSATEDRRADTVWTPFDGPAATVYTFIIDLAAGRESEARVSWNHCLADSTHAPSPLPSGGTQ